MLWLPTTEAQDALWTEASISTQRIPEPTDIENESTHSSDATVALGGPEAEGHPRDTVYSNHFIHHLHISTEPFRKVIWQYTNTLCTTHKQMNLTNSLLQDIAVFNEHDSTRLEEWLTDIKTAADLINESRARLAKVKLRGLTCTLVTEAITSDKSWD